MRKFVQKYALISSEELDEIGYTAMKHPVYISKKYKTVLVRPIQIGSSTYSPIARASRLRLV